MKHSRFSDKIVFLCDEKGKILQLLHDGLDIKGIVKPGILFTSAVHQGSMGKALNFLLEIRNKEAAIGWELLVPHKESPAVLHFAGIKERCNILMVGAKTRPELHAFIESWIKNKYKDMEEERRDTKTPQARPAPDDNDTVYLDELTHLYNEISNMHREVAKKNVELEKLNELKNQFLGMAAHDLRTALWTIQTYSQFLSEEARDSLSEEQMMFLETIMESSESAKNIVEDYLDIATIEAGRLKLEMQMTDVAGLIRSNVEMNRILAARKRIRIELACEDLPELMIDAYRIEQVLNNLIGNAIKFSPQQTTIRVHAHRAEKQAVIRIEDEGVGIPEDVKSRLFQPFEAQRTKGTEEERGSGLGLAIVCRIVQEHGGRVWVESNVGEGSSFYVSLPVPE